jgi:hypothetical protein
VITSYANLEKEGHFGLAYLKCRNGGVQVCLIAEVWAVLRWGARAGGARGARGGCQSGQHHGPFTEGSETLGVITAHQVTELGKQTLKVYLRYWNGGLPHRVRPIYAG